MFVVEIAGPPSSGKTTIFERLKEKFPQLNFLYEINPYVLFKNHKGSAYVTLEQELKIINADLERLKRVVSSRTSAVIETGIFHLVYLRKFLRKEKSNVNGELIYRKLFKEYMRLLNNMPHLIIFIDTKPHISWKRRRVNYRERVDKIIKEKGGKVRELMKKYKDNIYTLYPLFKNFYEELPFYKVRVNNNVRPLERFVQDVERKMQKFLESLDAKRSF